MSGADPKTPGTHSAERPAFMAFTSDKDSLSLLRQFAAAQGWGENAVHSGDIDTASEYLKTHASPLVLCVDIASVESAPAALDRLADVCDPTIKVIVSGAINEYSFYCWLVDVGVSNYLLKPFAPAALDAAYRKAADNAPAQQGDAPAVKKNAKIITVMGTRGGVGATTIGVNMAWILANELHHKTALLDFDPQLGTVALALDLEPGKGLRDALEKPERIDGLFLDRVMVKLDGNLSILSTEEPLEEEITATEAAAEALFKQARPKFSHIIVDVPRTLSPFTRYALKHSDHIVCVTEYTLMGLRESLRYLDYCRDILKIAPPVFVANRVGLAGKHQMPQPEFEKGLGRKIDFTIPFVLDAHVSATTGEVLAETFRNAPATKVLQALSANFSDARKPDAAPDRLSALLTFLKRGK